MLMGKNPPMRNAQDKIFIDADAFVALLDLDDPNHQKARRLNKYIERQRISGISSNFAICEAITVISQNVGHATAVNFGQKIFQNEVLIIETDRQQELEALQKFSQATSKNVRFTDFVNMVIMDRLHIDTIFSFDRHYSQAGFKLLSISSG